MACRTMQLRFFKLGTVLTYAFNVQWPGVDPGFSFSFFFFFGGRKRLHTSWTRSPKSQGPLKGPGSSPGGGGGGVDALSCYLSPFLSILIQNRIITVDQILGRGVRLLHPPLNPPLSDNPYSSFCTPISGPVWDVCSADPPRVPDWHLYCPSPEGVCGGHRCFL